MADVPLHPAPEDEGRHPPGEEALWNESWYFDWVADDGVLGGYVRLGLYPNLGVPWYTAFVTGAGRPTIAVVDLEAPLPDEGTLRTRTAAIEAEHLAEEPLDRFRVTCKATGERHDDPSALLRGESGDPSDVEFDLTWETDGDPYQYRIATRYEIPCRIRGTVTIDGDAHTVAGTGQRDHSWGLRDWWAMNWCWMAGRLDDGSRVHAVQIRLPDTPPIGIGYVQAPGRDLVELTPEGVEVTEEIGANGLPTSARIQLDPPGLDLEIDPIAHDRCGSCQMTVGLCCSPAFSAAYGPATDARATAGSSGTSTRRLMNARKTSHS